MSATAATMHSSMTGYVSGGASETAGRLAMTLIQAWQDLAKSATGDSRLRELISRVFEIRDSCSTQDWDGEGATAIPSAAAIEIDRFLRGLPSTIPAPEIDPAPNGSITMEWYFGQNRSLVLAFRGNGSIIYSGLFGAGNEEYGRWIYVDQYPPDFIKNLDSLLSMRA
jgi:hypothetical protein